MKNNKIYVIAALLGTTLVSCQKEQRIEEPAPVPQKMWTLTVQATKVVESKALSLDGSTLNAYWAKGEKVAVYNGATLLGTLEVVSEDKANPATLSGQISVDGVSEGNTLNLLFPGREDGKWTYVGQDGSAPEGSLAANYDYAMATLTVATLDSENMTITTSGDVNFANQQSIYRFGFKVGGSAIAVNSFILTAVSGKIVRSRSNADGTWASEYGPLSVVSASSAPADNLYCVSIRNENASEDTYNFAIVDKNNALYEGQQVVPAAKLEQNGKFIGAKNISISQKTFAPASGTITKEVDVL